MDYRSNNSPYRSLPLMQRDEIARRSATSAQRASDAAEHDESRRWDDDYAADGEMERTLPRRRPSASYHGSIWERSASEIEETLRPQHEHVSAYLDESSVVRVTRRSDRGRTRGATDARDRAWQTTDSRDDRSRSWQTVDSRGARDDRGQGRQAADSRHNRGRSRRQDNYIYSTYEDSYEDSYEDMRDDAYDERADRYAPRSQRFSLVGEDDRPRGYASSRDRRSRREDERDSSRQDRYARDDARDDSRYERYEAYESYDERDEFDEYEYDYDDYDDYAYDDRPGIGTRISQGFQAVVRGLLGIPRAIGSGIVGLVLSIPTRAVIVLGVLAVAGVMLYAPIRDLYIASRQLDTLQATYDALAAENAEIREELEVLQTKDGIENEARARGYVEPGETKVVVEGLPEAEDATAAYTIEDVEIPDNRTWYIRILDDLFGYNPEA